MSDLDAAWRELEADALASDGRITDADVKNAIKRQRPHIEAAVLLAARTPRETPDLNDGHEHVTIRIDKRARQELRTRLFESDMRGVGYTDFILEAVKRSREAPRETPSHRVGKAPRETPDLDRDILTLAGLTANQEHGFLTPGSTVESLMRRIAGQYQRIARTPTAKEQGWLADIRERRGETSHD